MSENKKAEQQGTIINEYTLLKIKESIIKGTSSMNDIYVAVYSEYKKNIDELNNLKKAIADMESIVSEKDDVIKKMKIELKSKKVV